MTSSDLKKLQKPIPLKWRVRSAFPKDNPTNVILVGYIDSRQVQDVLDDVVGPANWQTEYFEVKNKQFCKIGIKVDNEWVWKGDSGAESSTEKGKGETSDSFKRAAVHWGINRTSYKVGEVRLKCMMYKDNKPYPVDETGKFIKGQALFDLCNKLGKIEDFELEFENSITIKAEQYSQLDTIKAEKQTRASRPRKPKTVLP